MHISEMSDLTGKTALVTGGSRGIGLEIARGLGEAGASVAIVARGERELDQAVQILTESGITAVGIAHDLSRLDAIPELVEKVCEKLGPIDILVNNAAVSFLSSAVDHTIEDWLRVMDINTNSIFFLSQEVARRCMIPRNQGKIVNIASIGALGGTAIDSPFIVSYSASKGAVVSMTRALATEWGVHNINVNVIAPGNFPSAMTEYTLPPEHRERVLAKTPLRRVGGTDDMKGVVLFFASELSRHVTGQLITVDGGLTTTNYSALSKPDKN